MGRLKNRFIMLMSLTLLLYPAPPPAQAQAHDTQAHTQAQDTQAHAQLAAWWTGSLEVLAAGAGNWMMALANFAMLATKLFAVFSTEATTLFAKSEPGIVGGLAAWVTTAG
jgi:hypothetical protein